jgi:hypothetical protein
VPSATNRSRSAALALGALEQIVGDQPGPERRHVQQDAEQDDRGAQDQPSHAGRRRSVDFGCLSSYIPVR